MNKKSILDQLQDYFENSPIEVLRSDMQEIINLNEIGPDTNDWWNEWKPISESMKITISSNNHSIENWFD